MHPFDPTAGQSSNLVVRGFTEEVKKLIDKKVIGDLPLDGQGRRMVKIQKKELLSFIMRTYFPSLLEHFKHYKDDDELYIYMGRDFDVVQMEADQVRSAWTKATVKNMIKLFKAEGLLDEE